MFKVGDWVSSDCFDGIQKIVREYGENKYILDFDHSLIFYSNDLTLVCGFKKGDLIEVWDSHEYSRKEKFVTYVPEAITPFVTIDEYDIINSYKHAKLVSEKEYKSYKEFKNNWIGKKLIGKENSDFKAKIIGFDFENKFLAVKVKNGGIWEIKLQDAFKVYLWAEDGSPFGELE